jgi:hypothetical protein
MQSRKLKPTAFGRYDSLVQVPVEYLNERDVSDYLDISVRTLQTWRYRGQGPAYERVGNGPKARVRYSVGVLAAWKHRRVHRVVPDPANSHAARVEQQVPEQAQE